MATTWTIAIDWDRDGEFSGDDIVTERAGGAHMPQVPDLVSLC